LSYCTISVDVDSFDSLLKFHGLNKDRFGDYDPVYKKAVPRFIELFDEFGIKATFFVVGEDCLRLPNRTIIRNIVSRGHEIANHSLNHKFAFSMLPREIKMKDIVESTRIIGDASGYMPVGFRAPGYDVDEVTIDLLDKMGYLYDSSLYKFIIYPLIRRASYLRSKQILRSQMLKNLQKEIKETIVSPMHIYRPMAGKFWRKGEDRNIFEVPVSIMPFLGFPFNTTFLFLFGPKFFDLGFWLTRKYNMNLNYNFHSTDMISSDCDKIFLKHPGLNIDLLTKQSLFRRILKEITKYYKCLTLESFCQIESQSKKVSGGEGTSLDR